MNRYFLKEAIADAKAVKESAIANAKAALEESFTPHLKNMLSMKLQEMDKEDDVKEMMSKSYEEDDVNEAKEEEEAKKAKNEAKMSNPVMRKGLKGDDPAELETEKDRLKKEDMNLDEILAELESDTVNEDARTDAEEEGYKDGIKDAKADIKKAVDDVKLQEDERTDAEEEGYEDGMKDEKEDLEGGVGEEEVIDIEDMTDEDLKGFIEDVIEDMVTAGELEAGGDAVEMSDEEEEVDVDVDVDVDTEETEETETEVEVTEEMKSKEEVKEIVGVAAGMAGLFAAAGGMAALQMAMENPETAAKYPKVSALLDILSDVGGAASAAKFAEATGEEVASEEHLSAIEDKLGGIFENARTDAEEEGYKDGMKDAKADMKEAYSTIKTLKSELNEINLLNAKLLYTNKIFKSKTLNENQKVKVLTAFDKAETVKEAKLVYETLQDGLKAKLKAKNSIKESRIGRASKTLHAPKKANKKPIVESNQMVDRFKKLAGII